MKLSIRKAQANSIAENATRCAADELKEIESLYARLRDNPYSDSESVRQTIIGSILMLIARHLYTSKP